MNQEEKVEVAYLFCDLDESARSPTTPQSFSRDVADTVMQTRVRPSVAPSVRCVKLRGDGLCARASAELVGPVRTAYAQILI